MTERYTICIPQESVDTIEECPMCGGRMRVQHGYGPDGYPKHYCHCPTDECGDYITMVGYDCPGCQAVQPVKTEPVRRAQDAKAHG